MCVCEMYQEGPFEQSHFFIQLYEYVPNFKFLYLMMFKLHPFKVCQQLITFVGGTRRRLMNSYNYCFRWKVKVSNQAPRFQLVAMAYVEHQSMYVIFSHCGYSGVANHIK